MQIPPETILKASLFRQVGVAAFDLRSAALHLSQYIETSISYQNTKTLLNFYEPMVVIVPPNKLAADGMVGVSTLVDKHCESSRKVWIHRKVLVDGSFLFHCLTSIVYVGCAGPRLF